MEGRKIGTQPSYCITFPFPKTTFSKVLDWSNYLAVNKTRAFSNIKLVGRWKETLFRLCAISPNFMRLRILIKCRFFNICKIYFGQIICQSSKNYSQSFTVDTKSRHQCRVCDQNYYCCVGYLHTKVPSTRIRIFLNPQLFLSGYENIRVHTLCDHSVFISNSPVHTYSNSLWIHGGLTKLSHQALVRPGLTKNRRGQQCFPTL